MKQFIAFILMGLMLFGPVRVQYCNSAETKPDTVRFVPVAVFVDSGGQALAAYQFEFKAVKGRIKIVGVEGGQSKAFREPPYYDSKALMHNRIIIAAFHTGRDLPTGKTRVATLHLQVIGEVEPEYSARLMVAATADGKEIPASMSVTTEATEGPSHF